MYHIFVSQWVVVQRTSSTALGFYAFGGFSRFHSTVEHFACVEHTIGRSHTSEPHQCVSLSASYIRPNFNNLPWILGIFQHFLISFGVSIAEPNTINIQHNEKCLTQSAEDGTTLRTSLSRQLFNATQQIFKSLYFGQGGPFSLFLMWVNVNLQLGAWLETDTLLWGIVGIVLASLLLWQGQKLRWLNWALVVVNLIAVPRKRSNLLKKIYIKDHLTSNNHSKITQHCRFAKISKCVSDKIFFVKKGQIKSLLVMVFIYLREKAVQAPF